ncbi:MAG: hypothetical protein ABIP30_04040 [Ferruginibacter sp.]
MIRLLSALFFLCVCNLPVYAQVKATGAGKMNTSKWVTRNIKKDFGAVGNGKKNDHSAFKKAVAFITKNGGNVRLLIPAGTYIVGKQTINKGKENKLPVYQGDPIFAFQNIKNVSIEGVSGTKIIYMNGMFLGTFEPETGAKPANLAKYNPSAPKNENPTYDYKPVATIGDFIDLVDCQNISIKNIDANGNSDKYSFGGYWGLGGKPYEISNCYGLYVYNSRNCTLENLKLHDFAVDNICIGGTFLNGDTSKPLTNNIYLNKIDCYNSGRNNLSWVGGKNVTVCNSSFNYAGAGKISTSPAAGMDIEPEGLQGKVGCMNGYFYNNTYKNNVGIAAIPGTSIDNPARAEGYGYSYDHYFRKCAFIGKTNATVYNFINRVTFDSCEFYGYVLNYGSSTSDSIAPATFKNCLFTDCYQSERMFDQPLLSIEFGYRLHIDNCTFKKYYSSGPNDWVFFYGTNTYACDNLANKPLFENSTFSFFAPADNTVKYICIARQIKFRNNKFYKPSSDNIRWYIVPGCVPKVGEGNVDLGKGMQYFILPDKSILKCK